MLAEIKKHSNGGRMRRVIKRGILGLFTITLVTALALVAQVQLGNAHTVVEGELYRAGQPTAENLADYKKKFGIQSVLNLRGENASSPWYQEEVAASEALGVTHINFRMKAARELSDQQALELIEVMRRAPKPLLIHCNAGADRTGLAAALYLAAVKGEPEEVAENQLSIRYGHLPYYPFFWTSAQAMYRTFERMEPLLGFTSS